MSKLVFQPEKATYINLVSTNLAWDVVVYVMFTREFDCFMYCDKIFNWLIDSEIILIMIDLLWSSLWMIDLLWNYLWMIDLLWHYLWMIDLLWSSLWMIDLLWRYLWMIHLLWHYLWMIHLLRNYLWLIDILWIDLQV